MTKEEAQWIVKSYNNLLLGVSLSPEQLKVLGEINGKVLSTDLSGQQEILC